MFLRAKVPAILLQCTDIYELSFLENEHVSIINEIALVVLLKNHYNIQSRYYLCGSLGKPYTCLFFHF